MSKLIVEVEMNGIPNCCGLCDPLFAVVCALKHDQTIDKMMLRVGRPSWCPIKGVLPDEHGDLIDRNYLLKFFDGINNCIDKEDVLSANAVIAAERKDDGK